jgi:hypothetical protein
MTAVSAPPRVRQRLLGAPDGSVPVLHRGRHAVYVDLGGWCVGVLAAGATAVPCALRTTHVELPFAGERADVRAGVLLLDGEAVVPGRLVDVSVPPLPALPWTAPPHRPLDVASVRTMVGAGDGLTPYSDDVLCGWLAVHRAAGVATPEVDAAVRSVLDRTTMLSATLLDCAMHGEVIPEFAAWVGSLGSPTETEAAATLARVGHTSGAGLLEGGRRALGDLAARSAA